jgi:carbonic anhydrase
LEKIREQSQVLHRLEQQGAIAIVGGIYDIQSGTVRFLDLPAEWTAAPSTAEAQVATT